MSKKAMLIIAVGIVSVVFWFWVKPWVEHPFRLSDYNVWLKPLLALGLLSALTGLTFLLVKESWLKWTASVLVGLPFLFVFNYNKFYLIAFALMVLLHSSSAQKIAKHSAERIKINIKEIMGHGLPSVITPVLLLISFAFFFSPGVRASAIHKELPPTAKQVISRVVGEVLGGELEGLPPQERQETQTLVVEQVYDQINQFLAPYLKFMPPILAFGLFLILYGLRFVFVWIGMGFAVFLFWIMKKSGLAQIKKVQKEAEELEF